MTVLESLNPHTSELNSVLIEEASNRVEFIKKDAEELYFQGKSFKPALLATRIVDNIFFPKQIVTLTRTGERTEVYRYIPEEGVYRLDGEIWLKQLIQDVLKHEAKSSRINDVLNLVKIRTAVNPDEWIQPKHIIVLMNGVYDLSVGDLVDFSPSFNARHKIPIHYDPDARCPRIDRYLEEVGAVWSETGESAKQALIEIIAYLLYNDLPLHKFYILYGDQGTGKTTYINLVEAFIGESNLTYMSLQSINNYIFNISQLFQHRGNLGDDIGPTILKDVGALKWLTGGSTIEVPKKFGDNVKDKYRGKMIFACNEVPLSYDTSKAFYVRATLINFPNTFRGTDREDTDILSKLTTPEELSGLFNKAIKLLPQLIERKGHTNEPTLEQRELNYLKQSDTPHYFIKTCLMEDESYSETLTNNDLYLVYRDICHYHDIPVKSAVTLGRAMVRHLTYGEQTIDKVDSRTVKVWVGVKLTSIAHAITRKKTRAKHIPLEDQTIVKLITTHLTNNDNRSLQSDITRAILDNQMSIADYVQAKAKYPHLFREDPRDKLYLILEEGYGC